MPFTLSPGAPGTQAAAAAEPGPRFGLDEVVAEVLPGEKAAVVRRQQAEGRVVAMESAGVTLVRGDLRGIVRALRLSRATLRLRRVML